MITTLAAGERGKLPRLTEEEEEEEEEEERKKGRKKERQGKWEDGKNGGGTVLPFQRRRGRPKEKVMVVAEAAFASSRYNKGGREKKGGGRIQYVQGVQAKICLKLIAFIRHGTRLFWNSGRRESLLLWQQLNPPNVASGLFSSSFWHTL